MNKLQLWFTMALLAVTASVSAQETVELIEKQTPKHRSFLECVSIGGRGGVGFNTMRYSNSSLRKYDASIFALENYGVFVEFRLSDRFFLRPEFIWMKRGQEIDDRGVQYDLEAKYYDIRLPLLFKFGSDAWKVQPYVMAAPVVGIAHGGHIKLDGRQIGITDANLEKLNFGAQLGGGIKVPFWLGSFGMEFGIEASYHLGLYDTYSDFEKSGSAIALNQPIYDIEGTRMNRGIESSVSLAIPLNNFRRKNERKLKVISPKPVKSVEQPKPKPQAVREVSLPVCDYFKIDGLGYFVTDGYNLPNRNISVNGLYFGLDRKAPADTAASNYMKRMTRIIRKSRFVHIDLMGEPIEKFMIGYRDMQKQVGELQRLCDSLLNRPHKANTEKTATDSDNLNPDHLLRYEIQICVMSTPLKSSTLDGRQMKMEKANDRYSYSLGYSSRAAAESALPGIVKRYPDAYIRTTMME